MQEIQDWKDSTLNAIHDCLNEIDKVKELTAANHNLHCMVDRLQGQTKQHQSKQQDTDQLMAELAEATHENDRLQDNVQVCCSEHPLNLC